MLSKKSAASGWNATIESLVYFLNRTCASHPHFESMLRRDPPKLFSRQHRPSWELLFPTSFHRYDMTGTVRCARLLEDEDQRKRRERRDHQQLVIVDIGDDLRLTRDQGVKRGASCGANRVQELRDRRMFERAI